MFASPPERAKKDDHEDVRSAAFQAIASAWPDDEARELLEERAKKDDHEDVRSAAFQAIASAWPDDEARELLEERAKKDDHEGVRIAALQAIVSAWARELGAEARRILSRDLDGIEPYLDPREPIPDEHITRAAEHLDMTEDAIRQKLADCEPILGWNPLKGAR